MAFTKHFCTSRVVLSAAVHILLVSVSRLPHYNFLLLWPSRRADMAHVHRFTALSSRAAAGLEARWR